MESGTKLGHYEILSFLGKGGMGEVWCARDTKLGREVAIKTLPEEFAKDANRLARFEREAKLLASLNHPNIAAIHGFEEDNGTHFLVLELVEGDTLADQLKRGAIPVEESLELALQIAEALEAAHEKGVIHRDLKPANIEVTPDGKVKVLDFGLAKALAGDEANLNLSNSPTLSMAATQQGVILGTAAYMSPEQARGESTDKRADIWAFGCVLFEMLTGRQTWRGRTVTDVIAGLVAKEPEWNVLPSSLHPRIRFLLERCLEKEAKDRCQGIAEARVYIQKAMADPNGVAAQRVAAVGGAKPQSKLPWIAAIVLVALISGTGVWLLRPVEPRPVSRSTYVLPEGREFRVSGGPLTGRPFVAISSDGSKFAYTGTGGLYVRSMDELEDRLIPGTETSLSNPTFSPDGEWLAFWSRGQLRKIAVVGGAPVPLADSSGNPAGINWDEDGAILYETADGIMRVSSDGGEPELLVPRSGDAATAYPQLLPGGNAVLFSALPDAQVWVQSLDSEEPKMLFPGRGARYVPTGHLVYLQDNVLFAVPFDVGLLEVTGGHVSLVEGVRPGQYSVSESGSLVWSPAIDEAPPESILALVDWTGLVQRLDLPPNLYRSPRLSPDGSQLAVEIQSAAGGAVWIYDLSGATRIRRLTQPQDGRNTRPVWTPDGQRVTFASDRTELGHLLANGRWIFWCRTTDNGRGRHGALARILVPGHAVSVVCQQRWSAGRQRTLDAVARNRGHRALL